MVTSIFSSAKWNNRTLYRGWHHLSKVRIKSNKTRWTQIKGIKIRLVGNQHHFDWTCLPYGHFKLANTLFEFLLFVERLRNSRLRLSITSRIFSAFGYLSEISLINCAQCLFVFVCNTLTNRFPFYGSFAMKIWATPFLAYSYSSFTSLPGLQLENLNRNDISWLKWRGYKDCKSHGVEGMSLIPNSGIFYYIANKLDFNTKLF